MLKKKKKKMLMLFLDVYYKEPLSVWGLSINGLTL